MRWVKRRLTDNPERGAAGVMVAVMLLVLIGAGAMAVDVGEIYSERAELQNGADAGALSAASLCSKTTGCTQASANSAANTYANANAKDSASNVQSVDLSVAGQVTVVTSTKDGTSNAGFLRKMFASALNTPNVTVGAKATASWFYPTSGVSILPLTFATCEFKDDGLPHKILTQGGGSGALDCNGRNPSNQIIPGGFAWLQPTGNTGCNVTATVGQWYPTSTGASMPNGCDIMFNSSLVGKTVAIPVYAYTCTGILSPCTGSSVKYMIQKWAGFKVQGWRFSGNTYDPTNVFTTSEKGLYGTFVGYSADPSLFSGGTTTPNGNVVVVKLIN
ncbi:TadE/TadG family type IV pilus assembly protein [Arthrobacter sp. M4]|uniref:TadE/TadG family type IV pilus assembly protein n=1 Tax=Arthrobacter sp. M4 TaxID=218160 RepID=UPI001CDD5940|nr:TadE/TadG family type IV pilus assembly protein [Arthrobacter sp. M4]MCA4135126.1 Tad domain-containing protein [Arthrobacter sp. M4]